MEKVAVEEWLADQARTGILGDDKWTVLGLGEDHLRDVVLNQMGEEDVGAALASLYGRSKGCPMGVASQRRCRERRSFVSHLRPVHRLSRSGRQQGYRYGGAARLLREDLLHLDSSGRAQVSNPQERTSTDR